MRGKGGEVLGEMAWKRRDDGMARDCMMGWDEMRWDELEMGWDGMVAFMTPLCHAVRARTFALPSTSRLQLKRGEGLVRRWEMWDGRRGWEAVGLKRLEVEFPSQTGEALAACSRVLRRRTCRRRSSSRGSVERHVQRQLLAELR